MNEILKAKQQAFSQKKADFDALIAKGDEITDVELAQAETLGEELKAIQADISRLKGLQETGQSISKFENTPVAPLAPASEPSENFKDALKIRGRARFFKGATIDDANKKAYNFGQFILASCGNKSAVDYCAKSGILLTKAMQEGVNELGGFLVPDQFENDLIDLREMYGVFRRNSKIATMNGDTLSRPRRTGGLTAYFVGEGSQGTSSDAGWDRVQLTARKLMVLARWSSELNEDSVMDMGDTLAGEIAYAFANKEDECGFNGDGTSTYGGINGVRNRLLGVFTTSGGTGLIVGAGNAYSEQTLANFEDVAGALPVYAESRAAWYCSKKFYTTVMLRLALAAGGTTAAEIVAGVRREFLGYPVVLSQVMPATEANSQVCCVFGDLTLASTFGDRRQTSIDISEHSRFEYDELQIRGTERFDINVHDVGVSGTAGPVVGLITAAS